MELTQEREIDERNIVLHKKCPECSGALEKVPLYANYLKTGSGVRLLMKNSSNDYIYGCEDCSFCIRDRRYVQMELKYKDKILSFKQHKMWDCTSQMVRTW